MASGGCSCSICQANNGTCGGACGWLRSQRFGCLQQSTWLSPDPVDDTLLPLKQLRLKPESFTVIQGQPAGSHTDADLVRGAWDFKSINRAYSRLLELSDRGIKIASDQDTSPDTRRGWLAAYRKVWIEAVSMDPLLPRRLWPTEYLGERAWLRRQEVLGKVVRRDP